PCLQRLRRWWMRAGIAPGDARSIGGSGDSTNAGVLRRMLEGRRGAVLAWVHEVECSLAIRRPELLWIAGGGRVAWLCRSGDGGRLRIRHESDGNRTHRRST